MIKNIALASLLSISFLPSAFAAHPMCGETPLAEVMGNMKDDMKIIKQSLKAGDEQAVKQAAQSLLANIRQGDTLVPLSVADNEQLNDEQKAKFNQYQRGMADLESATMELIRAQDNTARKQALAKIGKLAKKGHKAFKMDCDA
ncbi:cytochrome b562 [Thalassotalea maritima]|uniref:cytochrome b562 n=1 Tax=Thalassotalea maritima TaxID=3242416 RepID=UPI003526EE38